MNEKVIKEMEQFGERLVCRNLVVSIYETYTGGVNACEEVTFVVCQRSL